jgi:hypothetical protein
MAGPGSQGRVWKLVVGRACVIGTASRPEVLVGANDM